MRSVLVLVFFLLVGGLAQAERRAFIVGVNDYANLPDLQTTLGDVDGYTAVFERELGFGIRQLRNPDTNDFLQSFEDFSNSIEEGDEVVFIFSGHGWSDGVDNYLTLSDAPRITTQNILRRQSVSLASEVLAQLSARSPALVFAIIDACRDNPFEAGTRTVAAGLTRQDIVPGTLVIYSAGARQVALDRLGPNDSSSYSVFTRSLLPRLKDPSKPLMLAIDETRNDVMKLAASVEHQQRPAVYSDVSLNYCFAGNCRISSGEDSTTPTERYFVSLSLPCEFRDFAAAYPDHELTAVAKAKSLDCPTELDAPEIAVEVTPVGTSLKRASRSENTREEALDRLAALFGKARPSRAVLFPTVGVTARAGVYLSSSESGGGGALLSAGEGLNILGYANDERKFEVTHARHGRGFVSVEDVAIQK